MGSVWQAPSDIQKLVREIKEEHHPHLANASINTLVSDGKGISDNRVVVTRTNKCTKPEKLSTGCDFRITVIAETWSQLTDEQRSIAIDEALCRCGVKREPEVIEINGKKMPLKDDWGRTIFTEEIAHDKEGNPRWCINKPDALIHFPMIMRHGPHYNEPCENTHRVMNDLPPKEPSIAERMDIVE